MNEKCCRGCKYWTKPDGVCVNAESDQMADFTHEKYYCKHWQKRTKSSDTKTN
jgi:RNA polymerase subunit RPABC4/transcription elongation factor Spt4